MGGDNNTNTDATAAPTNPMGAPAPAMGDTGAQDNTGTTASSDQAMPTVAPTEPVAEPAAPEAPVAAVPEASQTEEQSSGGDASATPAA